MRQNRDFIYMTWRDSRFEEGGNGIGGGGSFDQLLFDSMIGEGAGSQIYEMCL